MTHETHVARWREALDQTVRVDRQGVMLATLLVGIAAGSALLVPVMTGGGGGSEPAVSQSAELAAQGSGGQAVSGAVFAGQVALLAGGLVLAIALVRRVPAWLREVLSESAIDTLTLATGMAVAVAYPGLRVHVVLAFFAILVGVRVCDRVGCWWILNNALMVALVVFAGAVLGIVVGPWFLLAAMAGLVVYDHVFANERDWMFDLAGVQLDYRLPVIFVWPAQWTFDWDRLTDDVDDPAPIAWGLGSGDCLLPAAFVAALVAHWTGPALFGVPVVAWGALAGLAVGAFRLREEMATAGSGAGLPAIVAGLVAGFGAVAVLGVILTA